jgi:hypothetical protein
MGEEHDKAHLHEWYYEETITDPFDQQPDEDVYRCECGAEQRRYTLR